MTSTIEDQIRRFLAIARDSGASTNEREVALERASILMARHSITRLSDRSSPAVRRDEIETRTIMIPGGMTTPSLAQAHAVHQVAQACGATTYYTDERRRPGSPGVFVHVVGFDSDLDWLAPLITALTAHTASAWTQWRKASPGYKRMKPANQRRARAGFILGYAQGVAQRIRTTRRATITEQEAAGDSSAALTVRDRSRSSRTTSPPSISTRAAESTPMSVRSRTGATRAGTPTSAPAPPTSTTQSIARSPPTGAARRVCTPDVRT